MDVCGDILRKAKVMIPPDRFSFKGGGLELMLFPDPLGKSVGLYLGGSPLIIEGESDSHFHTPEQAPKAYLRAHSAFKQMSFHLEYNGNNNSYRLKID